MGDIERFLRKEKLPHIWCPGCGNGIVLRAILEAIDKLELDPDMIAMVSGIGCSSRTPGYVDFNTLHTTHGRAIPFATGLKLANRDLKVIVVTGDGDCAAIGGNHLIHAARRNIDLTVIMFNNGTYGMTSGQAAPTTAKGAIGTTAPYGNVERPFNMAKLVEGAGATYVARGTTYHANALPGLIQKAMENKGFSFVEVLTQCPVYYSRMNKLGSAADTMVWMRDSTISKEAALKMSAEKIAGRLLIGELVNSPAPEFCSEYEKIIEMVGGSKK